MSRRMFTAAHDDPVDKVLALMRERGIRHLPVVNEEGAVIGVLSQSEVLRMAPFLKSLNLVATDLMIPDPYIVTPETTLVEIVNVMAAKKHDCAVVVGERREVRDIFTTTDALWLLAGFMEREGKNRPVSRYERNE